ncbi:unnamed protein product [Adineta steineri]|uniref:Uncharacterized protein n=1 Tax=Adineta steineri TaxID=433720 RepID=A0A819L871_9BILA|nr:unnamed protein product [Adineta steineri]
MNFHLNEFNRISDKEIKDYLYDVIESIDELNTPENEEISDIHNRFNDLNQILQTNPITANGDVLNCLKNNDKNVQSSTELILYEQLLVDNKMKSVQNIIYEDKRNSTTSLSICHFFLYDIECCKKSTCLALPQLNQNNIKLCNSFQQLWSPQIYVTKSIDSKRSKTELYHFWSLIIRISKLIINGLNVLYSYVIFLRYDTVLFCFCYLLGILFGININFLIDFIFIIIYIISICMTTYEKWLLYQINLNEYNSINNESQCCRRIQLIASAFILGIISISII